MQFIDCAHQHVTQILEKVVPESSKHARLYWYPLPNILEYRKGPTSILKSKLHMSYGQLDINICWTAKSGKIYSIDDSDIDCGDIVFTVDGLDAGKIKHAIKPNWSLFTFPEDTILNFREQNKLSLSTTFIRCADIQLSKEFVARTGIKINQHIGLLSISSDLFFYKKGEVSKIAIVLYVNHNWNEISIQWTSKSGRIYDTADEAISCDDIVFSFDESFDALLYHKQMYPKVELPFKLKNLPFEIKIERLNIDFIITMTLKDDAVCKAEEAVQKIDKYIDDFNTKAEKKGEDCVHNWLTTVQNNTIVCEMDSGFAGPEILKALFKLFTKMDMFSKVIVE